MPALLHSMLLRAQATREIPGRSQYIAFRLTPTLRPTRVHQRSHEKEKGGLDVVQDLSLSYLSVDIIIDGREVLDCCKLAMCRVNSAWRHKLLTKSSHIGLGKVHSLVDGIIYVLEQSVDADDCSGSLATGCVIHSPATYKN